MNKNITVNEASGGAVHSGHNQSRHYSSKGEYKRIYTFRIPIWRPSWISHFTQAIYYITLQIYFGYHVICISQGRSQNSFNAIECADRTLDISVLKSPPIIT